jgi:hypothetical protein
LTDGEIVETVANFVLNVFENYMNHVVRVPSTFRKTNNKGCGGKEANQLASVERHDDLIIGSRIAGKFIALTGEAPSSNRHRRAQTALLGGSCPNVACLPSKNMIWSPKAISLARCGGNSA